MLNILPYFGQALIFGFLTLPRTVGAAGLLLCFLIGGLSAFARWLFWIVFAPQSFTAFEAIVISVADIALLSLPVYALLFRSRAGIAANLMDGIAMGAFLGIGYGLAYSFLHGLPGDRSFISWFLGSVNSGFNTFVPNSGQYARVVWAGYAVWGALLGFVLALMRRLKERFPPAVWRTALILVTAIVFFEILIFFFVSVGIRTSEPWLTMLAWFYWIDLSGRLARVLLVLGYLAAVGAGEYFYILSMASSRSFLLRGEPQTPTVISEMGLSVSALRSGWIPFAELRSFLRSRRRLATLILEQRGSKVHDPALLSDLARAEEQAAAKMMRAETALEGKPVVHSDDALEGFDGAKKFVAGMLFTLAVTGLFIFLNGWLGLLITRGLGNNPMGYFYATVVLAALAYVIGYFRAEIIAWLKKLAALGFGDKLGGALRKGGSPADRHAHE
jgi:hypothetical protein